MVSSTEVTTLDSFFLAQCYEILKRRTERMLAIHSAYGVVCVRNGTVAHFALTQYSRCTGAIEDEFENVLTLTSAEVLPARCGKRNDNSKSTRRFYKHGSVKCSLGGPRLWERDPVLERDNDNENDGKKVMDAPLPLQEAQVLVSVGSTPVRLFCRGYGCVFKSDML
jgi:hypothetical protein